MNQKFTLVGSNRSVTIEPKLSADGRTLFLNIGNDYPIAVDLARASESSLFGEHEELLVSVWPQVDTDAPSATYTLEGYDKS